jgi:hypothetical protein
MNHPISRVQDYTSDASTIFTNLGLSIELSRQSSEL